MAMTFKESLAYFWQQIINQFVRKEAGKGLSTNDFTNEDKEKLDSLGEVKVNEIHFSGFYDADGNYEDKIYDGTNDVTIAYATPAQAESVVEHMLPNVFSIHSSTGIYGTLIASEGYPISFTNDGYMSIKTLNTDGLDMTVGKRYAVHYRQQLFISEIKSCNFAGQTWLYMGNAGRIQALDPQLVPGLTEILPDTGENFCILFLADGPRLADLPRLQEYAANGSITLLNSRASNALYGYPTLAITDIDNIMQLNEAFIPDTIARTGDISPITNDEINTICGQTLYTEYDEVL